MELSKNGIKSQYRIKMREYISSIPDRNFIFEIKKCCGYSEILCVNKNETLADLHKNINYQFGKKYEIYVINNKTNEIVTLPDSNEILIRNYILENRDFFIPIYPLPDDVVYGLYFHEECKCNFGRNNVKSVNDADYVDFSYNNVYFT